MPMQDTAQAQLERLKQQVIAFENQYGWTTSEFYPRFERGELGDAMDFMEWSATLNMIANLQHTIVAPGEGGSGDRKYRGLSR